MKVIDAINKINKEEKFRFRLLCDGDIYKYIGGSLYNETVGERAEWIIDNKWLNEEVEIIEEDKNIEKVNTYVLCDSDFERIGVHSLRATEIIDKAFEEYSHKINEIIDYLDKENKQ